jgi:uncharacterized membrane protein
MKPGLMIGLIALVALLIGLVAGLSIVLLNDKASPSAESTHMIAARAPTAPPPEQAIALTDQITLAPILQLATVPAAATTPKPSPTALVAELREASEASQKAAAEAAAIKEEAAKKAAAAPSEAIYTWLKAAKITAVRLSESGNKMTLNGRTYTQGDTINYEMGIRCVIIQEKRILFMDQNDKKYMKML